jgi:XisI protein
MDSRDYPQIVSELLDRHAQGKPSFGNIEVETIFDLEHNRYQIVHMGWHHDSPSGEALPTASSSVCNAY